MAAQADKTGSFTREGIERLYGRPFIDGNSIKLLWRGTDAFREITDAVEAAKQIICLQFYIYRNDETGTMLANMLKQKASEGVSVYVLYDHLGSIFTPRSFWNDLRSWGVNVRASYPFILFSPSKYTRRDHRKLITIDHRTAFTGGLNIANEYWGTTLKHKRPWRDTGILIQGPAATELTARFFKAWRRAGLRGAPYTALKIKPTGDLAVLPIFSSSFTGRRQMRKLLYYSIFHADHDICFTTAYFIPSRRLIRAIENAIGRGVRVRLIVPLISDVMAAHYASRHFYEKLLKAGVEIYLYKGSMLHAKSYVFDTQWSVVGSANLDPRSLRRNDEGNVGILDHAFALQLMNIFQYDMEASQKVDLPAWHRRPLKDKLLERFFALFRRRL